MNQKEFFERVLRVLEESKIPYMVTGSVGAILFGEPRLTNDMDVVVEMSTDAVSGLCRTFPPPDFYLPPAEVIRSEVDARRQFNLIHVGTGSEVDFIIRKDREFSQTEFSRRIRVPFSEQFQASSATPEDIILSKLEFDQSGESEKHLDEIRGILRISENELDMRYLEDWARKLGLLRVFGLLEPE